MTTITESTLQKFLRSEISFYISVVMALLAFAGLYFGLSNRIDLLAQEVKFYTADLPAKVAALESRVTANEKDILLLKRE